MCAVADYFDKQVIVARLKTVSGDRRAFSTTATVEMGIQEMDRQERRELENIQDRAWIGYFSPDDVDNIEEGDKLILNITGDRKGRTREYKVVEKTEKMYDFASDTVRHVEIIFVEYSKS